MKIICDCGNEMTFTENGEEKSKRRIWVGTDPERFRFKVSDHHFFHIDCKNCGTKIKIFTL